MSFSAKQLLNNLLHAKIYSNPGFQKDFVKLLLSICLVSFLNIIWHIKNFPFLHHERNQLLNIDMIGTFGR